MPSTGSGIGPRIGCADRPFTDHFRKRVPESQSSAVSASLPAGNTSAAFDWLRHLIDFVLSIEKAQNNPDHNGDPEGRRFNRIARIEPNDMICYNRYTKN
jgi:hypothetical protein